MPTGQLPKLKQSRQRVDLHQICWRPPTTPSEYINSMLLMHTTWELTKVSIYHYSELTHRQVDFWVGAAGMSVCWSWTDRAGELPHVAWWASDTWRGPCRRPETWPDWFVPAAMFPPPRCPVGTDSTLTTAPAPPASAGTGCECCPTNKHTLSTVNMFKRVINQLIRNFSIAFIAFSALILLAWRQKQHAACKKWVSLWSEVQMICIRSSWCHSHPIISCFIKIQNGSAFLHQLTQVVLEKTPLNKCLYLFKWSK